MREVGVGRVLVASLHQGIADTLPTRLGFYEHWLHVDGLHEGTIGIAPVQAVLSFLRQEEGAYDAIMTRAGRYAAEWTVHEMTALERRVLAATPALVRRLLLLRVAARLVRTSCRESRATSTVERGTARIEVRASIFCSVREPVERPLCVFYAAAFTRLLTLFDVHARAGVAACRGTGGQACVFEMFLSPAEHGEMAAE
jgi:bacteriochlorophyll 4-vinyl reductase